jgi:hypothetical protein
MELKHLPPILAQSPGEQRAVRAVVEEVSWRPVRVRQR